MVGILIATHGKLAEGLLSMAELLAGKQEKMKTLGLFHGDGIEEFTEKVAAAYEELDDGEGVLVFVDIFGGSPSNAVMKLMNKKTGVKAITGVNAPMLLEAVFSREDSTVEELCDACLDAGKEGMILLHEKYQEMMVASDEEDDF